MNGFLHRLFGELTLFCSGGFNGRFLDLCRLYGVALSDVKAQNGGLRTVITPRDLYLVRHAARESGMNVHIEKRRGLVFSLFRIRTRYGFFAGIVLFLLIQFALSGHIWQIDLLNESTRYTDAQIRASLAAEGIFLGAKRDDINADFTENVLLNSLDGLKRVAVSVRDCRVFVQLADKDPAPPLPPKLDPPTDLVAAKDAYIVSVTATAGNEQVRPGDTVRAGELLVSGVCEDAGGHTRLLVASGEVVGQTIRQTTLSVSRKDEKTVPTGRETKKIRLFFYGLTIKFYREGGNRDTKCDIIEETIPLTVLGCPLPVSVTVRTERETAESDRLLSDEELTEKVTAAVKAYEAETLADCVIVRRDVSPHFENDDCVVTLSYVCEENIAVPVKRELG